MKKSLFIILALVTTSQVCAGNVSSQTYQRLSQMNNNIRTGLGQHLANQRAANMGLKTQVYTQTPAKVGTYTNYGVEGMKSQAQKPFNTTHGSLMDDYDTYHTTTKATTASAPSFKQPVATESLDDGYSYFGV